MKTAKTISIAFTPVDSIIDAELETAIKPFIGQLRKAAEEDIKLEKHRDEANPDIAAELFDKTYAAAVAGDTAAERRIYDMGPRVRLVERQQQIYNVREATRVNAAIANVDLFNRAGEAAIPAVKRAAEKAQAQHKAILATIGEPEAASHSIANNTGWRVTNLTGLGDNCRNGDGARGLLDRGGFTRIVLGEGAE
jgi:hypothetical protein